MITPGTFNVKKARLACNDSKFFYVLLISLKEDFRNGEVRNYMEERNLLASERACAGIGYCYLSKEEERRKTGEFSGDTKMSRLTLAGTPRQYSGHYDIYRSLKAFVKR